MDEATNPTYRDDLAKAVCGYVGPLFEELRADRRDLITAIRAGQGGDVNDMTRDDAYQIADAAIAVFAPLLAAERERCALICEALVGTGGDDDALTSAAAAIRDGADGTD